MPSEAPHCVRKLCFTAPFLRPLKRSVASAAGSQGRLHALPAAVFLLNSPSNTATDFDEYLCLWDRAQSSDSPDAPASRGYPPCTFICGDGAYSALLRYCDGRHDVDTTQPLCDALIGDMDSIDASTWSRAAGDTATMPAMPTANAPAESAPSVVQDVIKTAHAEEPALFAFAGHRYETVDDIPDSVIESLHRRIHNRRVERPNVLPTACQMTTDFQKCVLLLQRLQRAHPEDVVVYATGTDSHGMKVEETSEHAHARVVLDQGRARVETADRLCRETAQQIAAALSDAAEVARCDSLLTACCAPTEAQSDSAPSSFSPSSVCTVVLPTVIVIGALGGRLDHEIAAFCTLSLFARELNLILLNPHNIVFSCWPDGVTQWLPWDDVSVVDHAVLALPPQRLMCGLIPLGPVLEMETTGMLYNIVNGRRATRYDGYTQNSHYHFGFDGIVSTSNEAVDRVFTVDLRPLDPQHEPIRKSAETTDGPVDPLIALFNRNVGVVNPPTIITCQRQTSS